MAKPPRTATEGTFFLTAITYNRRRLFQVPANADLLVETLQHYRKQGDYLLHAFVVMPDHVHLLLTTQGASMPQAMQHVKGGFSHRFASKLPVWQRSYADHLVLEKDHFASRLNYIHQNPVRAKLAESASEYLHSSAHQARAI